MEEDHPLDSVLFPSPSFYRRWPSISRGQSWTERRTPDKVSRNDESQETSRRTLPQRRSSRAAFSCRHTWAFARHLVQICGLRQEGCISPAIFFSFTDISLFFCLSKVSTTLLLAFLHPTVTIIRITRGFSVFLWYRHATQGRFLLASPSFARHLLLVHTSQSACFDYWTRKTRRGNRCCIPSLRLQYFSLIYNRILVTPFSPTHLPSKRPVASSLLSILKFITLSNWSLV